MLVAGELRVPLSRLKVFSAADFAGSKKNRADWTVIGTFGLDHETRTLWMLDQERDRLTAPEILDRMREVQATWHPSSFYCEKTGPQLNLVHALRFAEAAGEVIDPGKPIEQDILMRKASEIGLPVRELRPDGDKVIRSAGAQALMSRGRLMTPRKAAWIPGWKAEVFAFPQGHDDQVDVLSYGAIVFLETLQAQDYMDQQRGIKRPVGYQRIVPQ